MNGLLICFIKLLISCSEFFLVYDQVTNGQLCRYQMMSWNDCFTDTTQCNYFSSLNCQSYKCFLV